MRAQIAIGEILFRLTNDAYLQSPRIHDTHRAVGDFAMRADPNFRHINRTFIQPSRPNRKAPYDLRQVVWGLTLADRQTGFIVTKFDSNASAGGLKSLSAEDAPEVGLGMLLRGADSAFNRVLRQKLAEFGISFSEFQHLRQLWDEEGLTQVELSRRIGIERASSTAVIVALLRKKLIRRSSDPSDKRKVRVFPTLRGSALRDRLWSCAIDTNTIAYTGLNQEDRRTLFRLLNRITANLSKALDE